MKEKIRIGIILILLLSIAACNSNEPDGKSGDIIKLSKKEITISAEANSLVITTGGTWWWINGIGLNDDWSYDISSIDTSQDNFLINENEFSIERKNANEIHISLTKNQSAVGRTLRIALEAGDYFDEIKIIQVGK